MTDTDITVLLRKADELKALFILGQRVIPFLEEIFLFINEIKPLLDDINLSIEENLKKIPGASHQLSKVTEATEMATTEIMDIIDGQVYKADIIQTNINKLMDICNDNKDQQLRALSMIQTEMHKGGNMEEILHKAASIVEKSHMLSEEKSKNIAGNLEELLNSLKEDSNSIMMSLQVQDITSQQIAAVNHLLETVHSKLARIMTRFQSTELNGLIPQDGLAFNENINISKLHRDIAFDPHAVDSIAMKGSRQDAVDAILKESEYKNLDDILSEEELKPEITTFSSSESMKAAKNEPTPDEGADGTEAFSQADIDALFGN